MTATGPSLTVEQFLDSGSVAADAQVAEAAGSPDGPLFQAIARRRWAIPPGQAATMKLVFS